MTIQYIYNTENEKLVYSESGVWARAYTVPGGEYPGDPTFRSPWREATQEEIDADALEKAKGDKVNELLSARDAFLDTGYEYQGEIVCPAWNEETAYSLDDLVQASDEKNYHSLAGDNLAHDPISSPEYWEEFLPAFKMNDATLLNVDSKCKLDPLSPDRYKFYCKCEPDGHRHLIDFGDAEKWPAFVKPFLAEQDRVMRKYNDYRNLITACSTVAEVDEITIDFDA